jgi:hypothetical protein
VQQASLFQAPVVKPVDVKPEVKPVDVKPEVKPEVKPIDLKPALWQPLMAPLPVTPAPSLLVPPSNAPPNAIFGNVALGGSQL